ncbi:MAG: hypothetical protein JSV16_11480, partial [Candidatus Hydrogenedentota bacterium]
NSWGTFCSGEWHWGQTFTTGMSGQLESVDVHLTDLFGSGTPTYPSTVSIVNLVGSVPSGSALGEVHVEAFVDGFNNVDFLSESIFLTAGMQYGIVISNDDPEPWDAGSVCWGVAESDVYSGGSLWNWHFEVGWNQDYSLPDFDFSKMDAAFRTHMVPEPATIVILCFGYLGLIRKRQTRTAAARQFLN